MKQHTIFRSLAFILFICLTALFQSISAENPSFNAAGADIGEFLTADNRIDLEKIRQSGYEGSLDLQGFDIAIDPLTGKPGITPRHLATGEG